MKNLDLSSNCFRKTVLLCVMLLTFIIGCKDTKQFTAEKELTFKIENAIKFSNSDFFSNKTVISLETNEKSLIHDRPCLKKDGDNLFVFSKNKPNPILRFDIKGNFLNSIGSIGQGSDEFTNIWDIVVNKDNSLIEILADNKILFFSYDGIFLKSEKINIPAISFTCVNGNYWFYAGNNSVYSEYRLFNTDKKFNIVGKYLSDKSNMLPMMMDYNFNQSLYNTFRESFYNNIYCIKEDSLFLPYLIKFPNLEIPADVHSMPPLEVGAYLRNIHYASIYCYLENDNYIYMLVTESDGNRGGANYHWIIDKKNNYHERIFKVDVINETYLFIPQLLTDDNYIYFFRHPFGKGNGNINYDLNPSLVLVNSYDFFVIS